MEVKRLKKLWDSRRSIIERRLNCHDGDKRATAESLGISLKTLYNYLNRYQLQDECRIELELLEAERRTT